MEKLVEKAKKAGVSELQGMVETVLNDKNAKGQIITTSFKFDEIVNLLPIIFDFKLSGSTGFPSTLQTGTFDRTSYVVASGLSNNVSKLHEYLYDYVLYKYNLFGDAVDTCSLNELAEFSVAIALKLSKVMAIAFDNKGTCDGAT